MKNKNGFSVLELFIVAAILGIILSILIPNILIAHQNGKFREMKSTGVIEKGFVLTKAIVEDDSKIEALFLPELNTNVRLAYASSTIENHLLRRGDLIEVLMRPNRKGQPRYNTVFFWRKIKQAEISAESKQLNDAHLRKFYKAIIMSDDATIVHLNGIKGNAVVYPALITELELPVIISAEGLKEPLSKGVQVSVSFVDPFNYVSAARQIGRIESVE